MIELIKQELYMLTDFLENLSNGYVKFIKSTHVAKKSEIRATLNALTNGWPIGPIGVIEFPQAKQTPYNTDAVIGMGETSEMLVLTGAKTLKMLLWALEMTETHPDLLGLVIEDMQAGEYEHELKYIPELGTFEWIAPSDDRFGITLKEFADHRKLQNKLMSAPADEVHGTALDVTKDTSIYINQSTVSAQELHPQHWSDLKPLLDHWEFIKFGNEHDLSESKAWVKNNIRPYEF